MSDKRRFTRAHSTAKGRLRFEGESFPVRIVDLSLRGARLAVTRNAPPAPKSAVTLSLTDGDCQFDAQATVIDNGANGTRVKFTDISEESLGNLLRLMRRIYPDGTGVESELPNLILDID